MNLYKILNIKENASADKIKKAYFKLAQKFHPDKGGDPEMFKQINTAYKILMDEDKRLRYDAGESLDSLTQSVSQHEQLILSMLAQVFCQTIGGSDPEHHDIIAGMRNHLRQASSNMLPQNIINMKGQMRKYEIVLKKVKSKKANNFLIDIASSQIENFKKQIASAEKEMKLAEDALKYLEDFSYEINDFEKIFLNHFSSATTWSI